MVRSTFSGLCDLLQFRVLQVGVLFFGSWYHAGLEIFPRSKVWSRPCWRQSKPLIICLRPVISSQTNKETLPEFLTMKLRRNGANHSSPGRHFLITFGAPSRRFFLSGDMMQARNIARIQNLFSTISMTMAASRYQKSKNWSLFGTWRNFCNSKCFSRPIR